MARTIVLVHGAWVTPASWDTFRQPFDAAGYTVHAPCLAGPPCLQFRNLRQPQALAG